jgi:hypothetical protein
MTIHSKDPAKELMVFFWASIGSLFLCIAFPFLVVAVFPLTARAAILTFHEEVKSKYYIPRTRAVLIIVALGAVWALLSVQR